MTDYQPFDAASALWQRTAAGDPGQEAPWLPPAGPSDPGPGAPGPHLDATEVPGAGLGWGAQKLWDAVNGSRLEIWNDFKAGLPVAGTFLFLAVLFLVGLVMVFLGASGVGQAIESGARGEVLGRARERGRNLVPGGKKKEASAKP